jgi:hypothetical protein
MKQERYCCDGLCEQGRHCPAFPPASEFQSKHPLHRWWAEERNTCGSAWIDFATFWQLRLPLLLQSIDWVGWVLLAAMVLSAVLVLIGLGGVAVSLTGIDLSALVNVAWKN